MSQFDSFRTIRTEEASYEGEHLHYVIAVLRGDQLDLIRDIVRDEVRRTLAEFKP